MQGKLFSGRKDKLPSKKRGTIWATLWAANLRGCGKDTSVLPRKPGCQSNSGVHIRGTDFNRPEHECSVSSNISLAQILSSNFKCQDPPITPFLFSGPNPVVLRLCTQEYSWWGLGKNIEPGSVVCAEVLSLPACCALSPPHPPNIIENCLLWFFRTGAR